MSSFISNENDSEICVICQELLTNSRNGPLETLHIINNVAHVFHRHCIELWIAEHSVCPIDRQVVRRPSEIAVALNAEDIQRAGFNHHYDVEEENLAFTLQILNRVSERNRSLAVVYASLNGNLETVESLLQDEVMITEEDRGNAVLNAAKAGHQQIVERLLQNGAIIPLAFRLQAIRHAMGNGHLQIVPLLLGLPEIRLARFVSIMGIAAISAGVAGAIMYRSTY